ncbi:DUF7453 family protein [Dokdonella koreensis]|uniref:Uncharacterized protein n=1 Tax=Dokdonella koreensis DS-123 TaxID=1300342 RepID=A0A160DY65_9GAMM|nr:choice-of-anchor tandem repeat NxxGxxAF-containing protein [Dokdonella koreensis]ANB18963.1 Hypothetical protein I596_2970 [Dokdonella koreensis DS-123]
MKARHSIRLGTGWLLACALSGAAAQTVRQHDGPAGSVTDLRADGTRVAVPARRAVPSPLGWTAPATAPQAGAPPVCAAASRAWHGQALPAGESGTLVAAAFMRSTTIDNRGRIAFFAQVDGAARNQGVFVAGPAGLDVVAMGCGGPGGSGATSDCGDLAPGGGRFSGFFGETWGTPDLNDAGDVLFMADLHGAPHPRGLFLYQAAAARFVKIAAVGEPSPLGGMLTGIGPGSLNNAGDVVLLASTDGRLDADALIWRDGVLSKYVAAGDPAPGGGTFTMIGTESWGMVDGTQVPGGPVPAINDRGQVAFRGEVSGGIASAGLFISDHGTHSWVVQMGDPVPGGGTYIGLQAPLLNNAGELAFFSDIAGGPGSAWVTGKPGQWRRALAFYDPIDTGQVWSLAFSRNPLAALNDQGDLLLATTILRPDSSERGAIVLSRADGSLRLLAEQAQPTPLGGSWGSLDGWPTLNNQRQARIGAGTPGLPGQATTQMVVEACGEGAPALAAAPAPGTALAFGAVPAGTLSAPLGVDLANPDGVGSAPDSDLRVNHAQADDPAFVVRLVEPGPFAAGVAADGQPDIEVRCAPTQVGPVHGELTLLTNDPAQPAGGYRYPLSCEGTDDTLFANGFDPAG